VLADRKVEALREAARALGPSVECHRYDQADQQSIETLAMAAGAVDVLVNNAGIMARASLLETGAELLRDIVAVDLVGVVSLTTLVARGMVERGGGAVVNIGSQMAFCGAEGRARTRRPRPASHSSRAQRRWSGGRAGSASTASPPAGC
jgi:short-subunit dehydrogenase